MRIVLNDFSNEHILSTKIAGSDDMTLMVSVIDSFGAITNDTISINLINFYEFCSNNLNMLNVCY